MENSVSNIDFFVPPDVFVCHGKLPECYWIYDGHKRVRDLRSNWRCWRTSREMKGVTLGNKTIFIFFLKVKIQIQLKQIYIFQLQYIYILVKWERIYWPKSVWIVSSSRTPFCEFFCLYFWRSSMAASSQTDPSSFSCCTHGPSWFSRWQRWYSHPDQLQPSNRPGSLSLLLLLFPVKWKNI